ncbi:hypothetical protein D3C87_1582340 [compost metagenome]
MERSRQLCLTVKAICWAMRSTSVEVTSSRTGSVSPLSTYSPVVSDSMMARGSRRVTPCSDRWVLTASVRRKPAAAVLWPE